MRVRWLGRVPYREAWDLQRAVAAHSTDDYLLLLEHPAVYTLGVNADRSHVLVDPASVRADMVAVDRGGDVTYHGPGQLVGYPVVTVGRGLHQGTAHVRRVEEVVTGALTRLGLDPATVGRLEGYPGVWVGLDNAGVGGTSPRKICAVGVRTSRGRTTHGFALNVSCDLAMFGNIVPCGISELPVTTLHAEGYRTSMEEVTAAVIASAQEVWGPATDVQQVSDSSTERATARITSSIGASTPSPVTVSLRRSPPRTTGSGRRPSVMAEPGLPVAARKPPWLRVQATMGSAYLGLRHDLRDLRLTTVCEEAGCPNIYECWSDGTATFMINGSRCTRACGFCQVDTGRPLPLDPDEPERVAEAVARIGLAHAVVTCVARDDLPDGGAGAFAATIEAVRRRTPRTTVEVLIADCKGDPAALDTIFDARPDVLNHNVETVARLQRRVRPSAGYARSLAVLARAKRAGLTTKSGLIVGIGEEVDEVLATLADVRAVGCDIVTIGQYLRPSHRHLPVSRWWTPEEFDVLHRAGTEMGFSHVQASPLTRSSYHAREAAESAGSTGPARSESAPADHGPPAVSVPSPA